MPRRSRASRRRGRGRESLLRPPPARSRPPQLRRRCTASLEAGPPAAAQAVGPPDVERAATAGTLEIPLLWLATMRAEARFPIRRQDPATVLALMLGQNIRRSGHAKSGWLDEGGGRLCGGRYRVFSRRVEKLIVILIRRRCVCTIRHQHALGGATVHHHLGVRE